MFRKRTKVTIPPGIKPFPTPYEIEAATILAQHFHSEVIFLARRPGYKMKTPDFMLNNLIWELKSPKGKGKNTIEYCVRSAKSQSNYQ